MNMPHPVMSSPDEHASGAVREHREKTDQGKRRMMRYMRYLARPGTSGPEVDDEYIATIPVTTMIRLR
jgi:hypothetical protein